MRCSVMAAGVLLALGAAPGAVEAKAGGCLKYGVGGAIIGHFAGGHGVAGAAAGCALGAYRRHRASEVQPTDRRPSDYGRPAGYDTTGAIKRPDRRDDNPNSHR